MIDLFKLLIFFQFIIKSDEIQCPTANINTILVNDKCFTLYKVPKDWISAQSECQKLNSTLVEPVIEEEMNAVYDLLDRLKTKKDDSMWIGATDLEVEGRFVWATDSSPAVITVWAQNQPDNWLNNEDCLALYPKSPKVNDSPCSTQSFYACQKDPCDDIGESDSLYAYGLCLKYYNISLTWTEAMNYCLERNSYLAEPTTPKLQEVIEAYLRNRTSWLGANDVDTGGNFQWAVSKSTITGDFSRPASLAKTTNYALWKISNWATSPGTVSNGFVCQKEADVSAPNPKRYISVLPKLTTSNPVRGLLQVTSNQKNVLYLQFYIHIDNIVSKNIVPLAPDTSANFYLNESVFLCSTDISTRYVEIHSSQPVTIIQYIMDSTMASVSSSLLYPVDIYTQNNMQLTSDLFASNLQLDADTDIAITTMMNGTNNLTMIFNTDNMIMYCPVGLQEMIVSNIDNITTNLGRVYQSFNIKLKANLDGSYLYASKPVMVSLGTVDRLISNMNLDTSFDNILPLTQIGNEYYILPSIVDDVTSINTTMKCLAVYDFTELTIFYDINETTLLDAGETYELTSAGNMFIYIHGNASFYVYQTFSGINHDVCLTSLLPLSTWRYDHQFARLSVSYIVIIYVIVDVSAVIVTNYTWLGWRCQNIIGTKYKGCYSKLPMNVTYLHLQLSIPQLSFGAYQLAVGQNSSFCHPMGINDTATAKNTVSFQHEDYLHSIASRKLCPTERTAQEIMVTSELTSEVTSTSTSLPTSQAVITTETTAHQTVTESRPTTNDILCNLCPLSETTTFRTHEYRDFVTSLKLNYHNLSSYIRTKISVDDTRPSAQIFGGTGILILTVVGVLFVLSDLTKFFMFKQRKLNEIDKAEEKK